MNGNRRPFQAAAQQARRLLLSRLGELTADGVFPFTALPDFSLRPRSNALNGDISVNLAFVCSCVFGMAPQRIADLIVSGLCLDGTFFSRAAAESGYLNLSFSQEWYNDTLLSVLTEKERYGNADTSTERIWMEYAPSACPDALKLIRGGLWMDCLASLLEWSGKQVTSSLLPGQNDGHLLRTTLASYGVEYHEILPSDCVCDAAHYHSLLTQRGFSQAISVRSTQRNAQWIDVTEDLDRLSLTRNRLRIFPALPLDENPGAIFAEDIRIAALLEDAHTTCPLPALKDNPGHEIRYAHARIRSILSALAQERLVPPVVDAGQLSLLSHPQERSLIELLAFFPETVVSAASACEPGRIARFALEMSTQTQRCYTACPVRGVPADLAGARVALYTASGRVLGNSMRILRIGRMPSYDI